MFDSNILYLFFFEKHNRPFTILTAAIAQPIIHN